MKNYKISTEKQIVTWKFHLLLMKILIACVVFSACKKYTQVNAPITSVNSANVFTNDLTAASALTGIYGNISAGNISLSNSITNLSLYASLSADELSLYNLNDVRYYPFYSNNLTPLITSGNNWTLFYQTIYYADSAIEGLNKSQNLTNAVKQQLLGEAKFIRAFCYFYLINLYGDVPLPLTLDYNVNSLLPRVSKSKIYQQILLDLHEAQSLLSSNYLQSDALTAYASISTAQRVRPTKWAATALLSRAYLYTGNWAGADSAATVVINNSAFFTLTPLANTFKMNSAETIWSLQPVGTGTASNTGDGGVFILPTSGPNSTPNDVYLSSDLINSFETGDQRKTNWVASITVGSKTYYYPFKYKVGLVNTATSEYIMVLRLAEQYLIRSEARAHLNNISGSQADINMIRSRAGLPQTVASDQSSLLTAVLNERKVELFTEWGHRWLDLQRIANIDNVMTITAPLKGAIWSSYKALYPIPQTEINKDPNLVQNPGY